VINSAGRPKTVANRIEIEVNGKDLSSSGAGETPLVGLAPALGNAIFDATGARLTSLPLAPRSFKSSGAVVSGG